MTWKIQKGMVDLIAWTLGQQNMLKEKIKEPSKPAK